MLKPTQPYCTHKLVCVENRQEHKSVLVPSLLTVWQCSNMVSELSLDKNCLKLSELVNMYSIMISLRFLQCVSFPKSSFEIALKRQLPSPLHLLGLWLALVWCVYIYYILLAIIDSIAYGHGIENARRLYMYYPYPGCSFHLGFHFVYL